MSEADGGLASKKRTLIIVETREPARVEEALRAALGLTLRGAAVEVWLPSDRPLTALGRRALGVLETFGHTVRPSGDAASLAASDAVEVWT
jgi:hypothetical protein